MDWNYPGFTACLVSALVLSLAMMFWTDTEPPFRGFHRFPCPCYGNSTLCSVPTQHWWSVCVRKMQLLGEPAIPMGLKAQSCPGSDSPAGSRDPTFTSPCCQRCVTPELWHLIHLARFAWGAGSEPPWISMWLWPLVLYKAKSSDCSLLHLNMAALAPWKQGRYWSLSMAHSTLSFKSSVRTPWLYENQIHSLSHFIDFKIWQQINK